MRPRPEADPRVLTARHARTLIEIADAESRYGPVGLRLEGGTALAAYYLGHRESEDLDLFGGTDFHAGDFAAFLDEHLTRVGAVVAIQGPANRGMAEAFVQWPDGPAPIKVQIARTSPFHLEPPIPTREGIPVAAFRDVVAGKLHALCDRTVVRDVIDLHATLWRSEGDQTPTDSEVAARLLAHAGDLHASDPGLCSAQLAQAIARAQRAARLSHFPLRLIVPISDAAIQRTCAMALGVLEAAVAERLRREW